MKLALISDIHGNFVALEAVLNDLKADPVDQILCLGDVVAFGPQPGECLRALMELECSTIMGNTDDWILEDHPFATKGGQAQINAERIEWCRAQLEASELEWIREFQPTLSLELENGVKFLGFHGSPHSYNDIIMPNIDDESLREYFAQSSAQIYAGGHTHLRMLRRVGAKTFINPGSVGLPFLISPMDNPWKFGPYAEYAVVLVDGGQLSIEFKQLQLNVDEIIQSAHNTGFPSVEKWIEGWQLGLELFNAR